MARHRFNKGFLAFLPFWSIPLIYSGVTILLGLTFPHLEFRYLKGFDQGVTVPVATALQVMCRLRSALYDLVAAVPPKRQDSIRHYIAHLDITVKDSFRDHEDQTTALQQDRQGLGLLRR